MTSPSKRSWVFCSAVMVVCAVAAEVGSTVEGCVYVLGVVFLLVRRYKYTEEDVALNPPVCDAQ